MNVHSKAKEISEATNGNIDIIESDLNHFIDGGNSKEWAVDRVKQLHKMADVIGPSQPAFRRRTGRKLKSKIGLEENTVKRAGIRIRKLSETAESIASEHYVEQSTVLSNFFDELEPAERIDDVEQRLNVEYAAIEKLAQEYGIDPTQVEKHASELAEEGETTDELTQRLNSRYAIAEELASELNTEPAELIDESVSVSSTPTSEKDIKNRVRENYISDNVEIPADGLSTEFDISFSEAKSQISSLNDEDTSIQEIHQLLKKYYSLNGELASKLEVNELDINQLETRYETIDLLVSKFDADPLEVEKDITKLVEKDGRTIDEARDQLKKRYEKVEESAPVSDLDHSDVVNIATKSIGSNISPQNKNKQIEKISLITDKLVSNFDISSDVIVEVILILIEEGVPPSKIETRLRKRYSTAKEISSGTDIKLSKLVKVAVSESPYHTSSNVVERRVQDHFGLIEQSLDSDSADSDSADSDSADSDSDPSESVEKQSKNEQDSNPVMVDTHAEELALELDVDKRETKADLKSLLQYSVPLKEAKQSVRQKHSGVDGGRSDPPDSLPISEITTDLDDVNVTVRVLTVGVRTIQYEGDEQTIREGRFGDETGTISYTAWQDFGFEPGDSVVVGSAGVRERDSQPELNLSASTSVAMAAYPVDTDAKIGGDSSLINLSPGDRGRNIEVTVKEVETRTIESKNGETTILSGVLTDGTTQLPFTDWNPHGVIRAGNSYRIEDVYIQEYRGSPSINISGFSTVTPLSDSVDAVEAKAGDGFGHDHEPNVESKANNSSSIDRRPDEIPRSASVSVSYDELIDEAYIGGGGNADVRKTILHTSQDKVTLAIKEPRMNEKGTLHVDQINRMLREAETWNKLDDHDHIVDVVDYDSDPLPWIAMEYMNGGHLGDRTGEMELQQALWTAITVTKGVRHAHRKGVAHLDLKPANILFRTIEDGWDVPKVADWGLSKHLLNHSNSIEGLSPQYASPEEFDSEYGSTDDITDIYQLGVVFYELFTGRPPFEGTPAKTMHKVLQQEPTPPSEIADVPAELDDILLTALAKQKDDRYEDILHLRDDLKSLFDSVTGELNRATTRSDSANEQNTGYKHSNESTVGESNISNNADTASTTHKQTSLSSNNKPIDTPTASTTDESAVNTESQTNADLSELLDEITSESQASETSQLRDEAFLKISDFTDGSLSLRDFTGNMLDIEELSEGTINNDHISVLDIQDFVGDIPVRGSSQENTPN